MFVGVRAVRRASSESPPLADHTEFVQHAAIVYSRPLGMVRCIFGILETVVLKSVRGIFAPEAQATYLYLTERKCRPHTRSIHDLAYTAMMPQAVFSGSQDGSARMWVRGYLIWVPLGPLPVLIEHAGSSNGSSFSQVPHTFFLAHSLRRAHTILLRIFVTSWDFGLWPREWSTCQVNQLAGCHRAQLTLLM